MKEVFQSPMLRHEAFLSVDEEGESSSSGGYEVPGHLMWAKIPKELGTPVVFDESQLVDDENDSVDQSLTSSEQQRLIMGAITVLHLTLLQSLGERVDKKREK